MTESGKKQAKRSVALPLAVPDDAAVQVWVQLAHAYHRIARKLEKALDQFDLTLAQFEVLARLHFDGPVMQTELAQKLLVSKGNICGLIDRMASADLVSRRADPRDRRANIIELTKSGRNVLARAFPDHIDQIKDQLGELTSDDLQGMFNGLSTLAERND